MTNLSDNSPLRFLAEAFLEKFPLSVAIYPVHIYKGGPIIIDQSADATAVTSQEGVTAIDGDVFIGIAAHEITADPGDALLPEDKMVECYVWPSIVGFPDSNLAIDDLGKDIYMSDTGTLSTSNGAYARIGKLFKVENGYAYVQIESPYVLNVP